MHLASNKHQINLFTDTGAHRERREHHVFKQLLQAIPGLEERLMKGSDEDIVLVADLVCSSRAVQYLHMSVFLV